MQNYFLTIPNDELMEDVAIHDPSEKLKVRVFDKAKSISGPKKGEMRYFITAGTSIIAFETDGYNKQRQLHILHMIAWYCLYHQLPNAQIHESWPLSYLAQKTANKKLVQRKGN
jgi:hypothetical protein